MVRLLRLLAMTISCTLVALSAAMPGMAQQRIGPSAPILANPPAGHTVHLTHPANTTLAFAWQPGAGGLAPTRYQVCVTEEQKACGAPGAWILPFTGQPPLTATTYAARLPASFQGKRLHWTVAACAPSPLRPPSGPSELCTYAEPRLLVWALPAPTLGIPADNVNASLRPTFTIRENVPGTDHYLFCLAKPGVECPRQPTVRADVIVAEVRGALHYQPPTDLTQYEGQTLLWTAAACNAVSG